MWFYHWTVCLKDADGSVNSIDPDQTANCSRSSRIWVYTVCPDLYVRRYMSHIMTKPTKWLRPAKTRISLGIHPVWSESSLCAEWVTKDPSLLHADSEDSDQTGRMPRLIWVFARHTVILLVLSCRGSHDHYGTCLQKQRKMKVQRKKQEDRGENRKRRCYRKHRSSVRSLVHLDLQARLRDWWVWANILWCSKIFLSVSVFFLCNWSFRWR